MTDDLTTGHPVIDAQHARILATLATLEATRDVEYLLSDLAGYFAEHFACEEDMMADAQYQSLTEHHLAHLELFDRWTWLRARWLRQGDSMRSEFVEGVVSWVRTHIEQHDRRLAQWMRQQRAGSLPGSDPSRS